MTHYSPTLRKGFAYLSPDGREGTWLGVRYVEGNAIELRDRCTGVRYRARLSDLRHATAENRQRLQQEKDNAKRSAALRFA